MSDRLDRELRRAETYEERRFGARRRIDRWEKDRAIDLVRQVGADAHLLDAPCGSGRFVELFLPLRRLTLLDRSPEMLEVCRSRVAGHAGAELIRGDATAIPLADRSVDVAWCMRLFHHLASDDDRGRVLAELARVTRRCVAISFYNRRSGRFLRRRATGRKIRGCYLSYAHLLDLADDAGLTAVDRRPRVNVVHPQSFVVFETR